MKYREVNRDGFVDDYNRVFESIDWLVEITGKYEDMEKEHQICLSLQEKFARLTDYSIFNNRDRVIKDLVILNAYLLATNKDYLRELLENGIKGFDEMSDAELLEHIQKEYCAEYRKAFDLYDEYILKPINIE